MPKRRRPGEGSLFWHERDRVWVARVDLGVGADGRRIRKEVSARSQEEVLRKLDEAKRHAAQNITPAPAYLTVGRYLEDWLTKTLPSSGRVKATTLQSYRDVVANYVAPTVGRKRLTKLSVGDVETMLLELKRRGLSGNTQRLARATLRRALRDAEKRGLVARNVAALADGPSLSDAYTGRTLTPEQAQELLEVARGHSLEVFVVVGLALGLRPGETLALRWDDLDLEGKPPTVTVGATLARLPGDGLQRQEPKTARSRRTLPLPELAVAALRAQRARQLRWRLGCGSAWHETGYVLTTEIGTPLDPSNARHAFQRLTETAGLGRWKPHEMRHSAASLLLAQGVPLRAISDVLGHSSIRVTSDVYGHLAPVAHADALARHAATIGARST